MLAGPLAAYSGATVRDFHPLPFSLAVTGEHLGTALWITHPAQRSKSFFESRLKADAADFRVVMDFYDTNRQLPYREYSACRGGEGQRPTPIHR